MDNKKLKAVYYPYSIIPDNLLKQIILYFDEITICLPKFFKIPNEYKYLNSINTINFYKNPLNDISYKFLKTPLSLKEHQQELQKLPQKLQKVRELQQEFQKREQRYSDLQQLIQDIQVCEQKVKVSEQEIKKYKQKYRELQQGIKVSEQEIKEREQQSDDLQQELQKLQQQSYEGQQENKKRKQEIKERKQKILALQQKIQQKFQKEIQERQQEIPQEHYEHLSSCFYTEEILSHEHFLSKEFLIDFRVSQHFTLFHKSYTAGQIPFTNNPKAQETFLKIFRTNVEKKENVALLHEVLRDHKTGYLAKEVMREHLSPLPGFEAKSHEDILEIKERLKDDLEDFKTEMRKLVWDIRNTPMEEGFEEEITRTIDTKINPTVKELEKRKKKDSKISKFLKLGGPSSGMILAMNAITNISTELALGIVGLGIGAPIAGEWLEARTKNQSEYNGLNFLVELKKELN